ncbi:MAG: hypothetical protein Q7R92_00900, partial [bacterium]|nr:hypothetical protein [bacterium]
QATKADMQELRANINGDIKTHMGVLYEKFSDEVRVVAESHLDTRREIKTLGTKVDMLIETVGEIKVDVTDIKDGLKNKTDIKDHKLLEKRVSVLEATA